MRNQMAYSSRRRLKLLLVEDESHVADALARQLENLTPPVAVTIACSRHSAVSAIQSDEFDFIICDLRIPPNDNGFSTDEAHGLDVHATARRLCPGTPCLFFTGYGTSQQTIDQLSQGPTDDIFGTGEIYALTQFLTKDNLVECVNRIETFNHHIETLRTIVLQVHGQPLNLTDVEERALQLMARRLESESVEVHSSEGLSGARALRTRIRDEIGNLRAEYFTKIAFHEKADIERQNYNDYVHPLLGLGGYPALVHSISAGLGKLSALLFQFAEEYDTDLFGVLSIDEKKAASVVGEIQRIMIPWSEFKKRQLIRIGDLRSDRIDSPEVKTMADHLGTVEDFEDRVLQTTTSIQHGDLHGANVLCKPDRVPVIVDFANVQRAPACLNPVQLELSVLFHSNSPFSHSEWPTIDQSESWFDLDTYLTNCPVPNFIETCRTWAHSESSTGDLIPVVYAEAARQLKYRDTNHERAIAIVKAAVRR